MAFFVLFDHDTGLEREGGRGNGSFPAAESSEA
jgi:hypothetical protein